MTDKKIFIENSILVPSKAMAEKMADYGVKKAENNFLSLFLLAILAGAFIALGAVFYTGTITGSTNTVGFGIKQLLGGLTFSLGLILVLVSGAELFTGNTLIFVAVLSGKTSSKKLFRNWGIVYLGNFIGSLLTVIIIMLSEQHKLGDASTNSFIGISAMKIADAKCSNDFITAFSRGVICNALVCLSVWMCLSAKTVTDKVFAIVPPITAFVAGGFEHCVANMYMIPYGMMVKLESINSTTLPAAFKEAAMKMENLSWDSFISANLIPVTLGNIVGGALFVGVMYLLIYNRKSISIFSKN